MTGVRQFLRYIVAGGSALGLHLLLMTILIETGSSGEIAASAAGFIAGCLLNYTLQYYITFASEVNHQSAVLRYTAVTLAMLILNLLIFKALLMLTGSSWVTAQLLASGVVFVGNFLINRRFTFAAAYADES
jgi:putative flippase GtrA